jgi:anti-sigma-K factor RskA
MQDSSDDITDLLVAYALGALEPEEITRVSQLLDERPELRQTLADLRATAGLLPYGLPEVRPPADLRQRTLDHAVGRGPATPGAAPAQRLRGWLYALGGLAAASLVALAIALSSLSVARQELAAAQQELITAQQELAAAERQVAALAIERDQIAQAIAGASSLAELTGTGGSAAVLASPDGGLVIAAQLPQLGQDQVYQLWVIASEGATPASAGIFSIDASGYGVLALGPGLAAPGVTLAVTAEPAPGSPRPTTPILVAGQIT